MEEITLQNYVIDVIRYFITLLYYFITLASRLQINCYQSSQEPNLQWQEQHASLGPHRATHIESGRP